MQQIRHRGGDGDTRDEEGKSSNNHNNNHNNNDGDGDRNISSASSTQSKSPLELQLMRIQGLTAINSSPALMGDSNRVMSAVRVQGETILVDNMISAEHSAERSSPPMSLSFVIAEVSEGK